MADKEEGYKVAGLGRDVANSYLDLLKADLAISQGHQEHKNNLLELSKKVATSVSLLVRHAQAMKVEFLYVLSFFFNKFFLKQEN